MRKGFWENHMVTDSDKYRDRHIKVKGFIRPDLVDKSLYPEVVLNQ